MIYYGEVRSSETFQASDAAQARRSRLLSPSPFPSAGKFTSRLPAGFPPALFSDRLRANAGSTTRCKLFARLGRHPAGWWVHRRCEPVRSATRRKLKATSTTTPAVVATKPAVSPVSGRSSRLVPRRTTRLSERRTTSQAQSSEKRTGNARMQGSSPTTMRIGLSAWRLTGNGGKRIPTSTPRKKAVAVPRYSAPYLLGQTQKRSPLSMDGRAKKVNGLVNRCTSTTSCR